MTEQRKCGTCGEPAAWHVQSPAMYEADFHLYECEACYAKAEADPYSKRVTQNWSGWLRERIDSGTVALVVVVLLFLVAPGCTREEAVGAGYATAVWVVVLAVAGLALAVISRDSTAEELRELDELRRLEGTDAEGGR